MIRKQARSGWFGVLGLAAGIWSAAAAAPLGEIGLQAAAFWRDGTPAAMPAVKDRFGKGVDGVVLWDRGPGIRDEVRYVSRDLPAGDYTLGLLVSGEGYGCFGELVPARVFFYRNNGRVLWHGYSEPLRPEDVPEGTPYQAEMLTERIHVEPGDTFRVQVHSAFFLAVGPLRFYRDAPAPQVPHTPYSYTGTPEHDWLYATWTTTQRQGDTLTQGCDLFNPGPAPVTFTLTVQARDFLMADLLTRQDTVTLGPGETVARSFTFPAGTGKRTRLTLEAAHPELRPSVRLSRFWVSDLTAAPRPTFSLHGAWEMCWVKAAEPGTAPPADAAWSALNAPCFQATTDTHCAWFRTSFTAPAYLQGERLVFRADALPSESWLYLNGQAVGHELHGALPFEVDVTAAFRPGQQNELLIAVRDWVSYSPANQERIRNGEPVVFKDGMKDVADYPEMNGFGLTGPLWLEARPALAIDSVAIATRVKDHRLALEYRLLNRGSTDQRVTLSARILDAGRPVRNLPTRTLDVPAGAAATVALEQSWKEARCWWPDDPHLYVLETSLVPASGTADRHLERFGFRDLRLEGTHLLLNEVPVKLRGTCNGETGHAASKAFWEMDKRCQAIWDWQTYLKHERAMQFARAHLGSRAPLPVELADETGLLLQLEGDTHQVKFTLDNAFWQAVEDHSLRLIDAFRNHASVVLWSAGNENMWGGYYQGEAVRTVGNRWQVRIARAMQARDPMHRPVNWEADNDLFGAWDSYSTHYPRELSEHPDLPNGAWWGPLDGKTVVANTMGPITLGTKPITVGEAYWPANLNRPYATTLINGDDTYRDGSYLFDGWMQSCRFLLAGLRDVEAAFVCPFTPLSLLPPQALVLKEEVSSYYGGRRVDLHLNVHNDTPAPARFSLRWQVLDSAGVALDAGRERLRLGPAGVGRLTLRVDLPRVTVPTPATLRLELDDDAGPRRVQTESRPWQIHPPPRLELPAAADRRLALFDPEGGTAALFTRLGIDVARTETPEAPAGSTALVLGRNALRQAPLSGWREALAAFVRSGGRVLILEQDDAPDFLPVPLTMVKDRKLTLAFVRAGDHPALAGLTDADLRWWADDHYVSAGNYRKPTQGNWLPLADAGSTEGQLETPLLEQYDGKGSILLCQFLLTEKAGVAPAATRLLGNLLHCLATSTPYRQPGATALLAGPASALRGALDASRLVYEDLTGTPQELKAERFQVAVADAATALDAADLPALRAFAEAGGKVLLHGAAVTQGDALEALLGFRLRFSPMDKEPGDVRNRVLRRAATGCLAGVSNHDLFWPSAEYLGLLRREGWWWYECGPRPAAEWLADAFCLPVAAAAERAQALTRPCALLQVPLGKGSILVSQLHLERATPETDATVSRLRSLLLTNLGCTLQPPGGGRRARAQRLATYQFAPLDLAPYANRGLRDDPAAGVIGCTNQGENDLRALPLGRQTLADVPFLIAAPRSIVALYSQSGNGNDRLPKEVRDLAVGQRADSLFFLHASAFCMAGGTFFEYRIHYADGTSVSLPIVSGQQVFDWWDDPAKYAEVLPRCNTTVAWRGDNPMRKGVCLLCYEWVNPQPDKEIRSIDVATVPESGYAPVPLLVGVTVGTAQPSVGRVEEVLGTAGVRVRLGTQIRDVYYIGVVGIEPAHPYYAAACAAHRAMAVGQQVTVVPDVVAQNSAGQTVAYVYLGKDPSDSRNLLNAKVIGDGLGSLGNFEGNNRMRMYLENLGFITQQGKKGLWRSK